MPKQIDELLTREQGAKIINYAIRSIDKDIAAGNLAVVRIGRLIRIRPSAIEAYIAARESRVNLRRSNSRAKA